MKPSVTVVIPTYNSARFVERGLASVAGQSYAAAEIIVSDDGSTDDTTATVKRFHERQPDLCLRILENPHKGPGAARNVGIYAAKCDWIAFLDSDDYWKAEKLETVVEHMSRYPNGNFFCHNQETLRMNGMSEVLNFYQGVNPNAPIGQQLLWNNLFTPSAVVCRRSLLVECGGFDEELMSAQDYELWLRLASRLRVVMINQALGVYVQRRGSISSGYSVRYLRNCSRILSRHRKVGPPGLALLSGLRLLGYFLWGKTRDILASRLRT